MTTEPVSEQACPSAPEVMLVVASSTTFERAVASLVEGAGYRAEHLGSGESAPTGFARTSARVAIFPFEDAAERVQLAAVEALARSVPVLLLRSRVGLGDRHERPFAPGVVCAALPEGVPAMTALLRSAMVRA